MTYKHRWYIFIALMSVVTVLIIIKSLNTCNSSLQSVLVAMISPLITLPIAIYSIYQTKINFIDQKITNYRSMIFSETETISKCKNEFTELHTQINIFIFNKKDVIDNKYNVDTIPELYSVSEGYMSTIEDINNNIIASQHKLLRLLKLLKYTERFIKKNNCFSRLYRDLMNLNNVYKKCVNSLINNITFRTFINDFEKGQYNGMNSKKQVDYLSGRVLSEFSLSLQYMDNSLNGIINTIHNSDL